MDNSVYCPIIFAEYARFGGIASPHEYFLLISVVTIHSGQMVNDVSVIIFTNCDYTQWTGGEWY